MLQRWLLRTRSTGVGACCIVAVDAARSAASKPILGVNVDHLLLSAPSRIASPIPEGVTTLAASDHVFLGRNALGLTVAAVVREEQRQRTAMRLGRMLLACCRRSNQIGDAVQQHWQGSATIVAADGTDIRGWNIEHGVIRLLKANAGLLIVSAGYSNGDPLPGGGWMIEKLARLESLKRVSTDDVQRSLAATRLGGETSCVIVVEPSSGVDKFHRSNDVGPIRKSA
jgi:hypothetical protein